MPQRTATLFGENLLNTLCLCALRLVKEVRMQGVRAGIDFKRHAGAAEVYDTTGQRAYSAVDARFDEQIIEINSDWIVASVRLRKLSRQQREQEQEQDLVQMPELGERVVIGSQAYTVEQTQIAPKRKTGLVWLRKL